MEHQSKSNINSVVARFIGLSLMYRKFKDEILPSFHSFIMTIYRWCHSEGIEESAFALMYLFIPILLLPFSNIHAATNVGGRISTDSTWTKANSPYIATSNVIVYGDTNTPAKLTIEPGVEVRFNGGTELRIGNGPSKGMLCAIGEEIDSMKIKFTANTTTPIKGYWGRIYIDDGAVDYDTTNATGTVLENCVIEYGGKSPADENIYVFSSSPKISKCEIRQSRTNGIRIKGIFYGINKPIIEKNNIKENGTIGILVEEENPQIRGNNINNNGTYPIKLYANQLNGLATDNVCIGNNQNLICLSGGFIIENVKEITIKNLGLPYFVEKDVALQPPSYGEMTLNIEPGVEMRFINTHLKVQAYTNDRKATIKAKGTIDKPIKFTSAAANPAPGDWQGILLFMNINTNSEFENCIVEYAGRYFPGSIFISSIGNNGILNINNCVIRKGNTHGIYYNSNSGGAYVSYIRNCEIKDNNGYGVYVNARDSGVSIVLYASVISNNAQGGVYSTKNYLIANYCYIYNNQNYGINNTGYDLVNAKYNWWGDVSGPLDDSDDRKTGGLYNPTGKGNKVTNNLDYSEWRTPFFDSRDKMVWRRK